MGGLCCCCMPSLSEVDERSVLASRAEAIAAEPVYRPIASNIPAFNQPPLVPKAPPPQPLVTPQRPETTRARLMTFSEQVPVSHSEDLVKQRSSSDAEVNRIEGPLLTSSPKIEGQKASSDVGPSGC
ncbi:hypothetical protein HPB52_010603 [Rhipicephalus sanguineus]|uniref:Uncharacterized protein n=1 Tax=Rhipicephalus sanguineus TaxID=34632 RepID=A0A9D4YNH5_RHISA|nr:hypothetical protein HPB52_010603 [Rhipicephalus sanguineus]